MAKKDDALQGDEAGSFATKQAKQGLEGDGERAVALTWEDAQKVGLFGHEVDGTPNRDFTVEGVTRAARDS
jgi:hypothetical protein